MIILKPRSMKNNQREFIEYARSYAETYKYHIWLGGSFLRGNPTPFSDVDISVLMDKDTLISFIYSYGDPIYISYTTNPEGIIIVIYKDGVAVDLDVIESIDVTDNYFFHFENIKEREFCRNSSICREICQRGDYSYQTERLFHRSLIKYLSGKKEIGVSIANEIAAFLNIASVTESSYKNGIIRLINRFYDIYPLDTDYRNLCFELISLIDN